MAAGKVITGFSKPWVALYRNTAGTNSYTKGQQLARGVSVSIEPTVSEDNSFFADNVEAENTGGVLTGGTLNLNVDGLFDSAEQLILGIPDPEKITVGNNEVNVYNYGDNAKPPEVGAGFIIRYMSDGVTTYKPFLLTRVRFNTPNTEAATQEENINFQSQPLTAKILRDGTSNHNWKRTAEDQATEEEAETILKRLLGVNA